MLGEVLMVVRRELQQEQQNSKMEVTADIHHQNISTGDDLQLLSLSNATSRDSTDGISTPLQTPQSTAGAPGNFNKPSKTLRDLQLATKPLATFIVNPLQRYTNRREKQISSSVTSSKQSGGIGMLPGSQPKTDQPPQSSLGLFGKDSNSAALKDTSSAMALKKFSGFSVSDFGANYIEAMPSDAQDTDTIKNSVFGSPPPVTNKG